GHGRKRLVALTVAVGVALGGGGVAHADGGNQAPRIQTITATDGHPFWVDDQAGAIGPNLTVDGRWVNAGDLRPGEWLDTPGGGHVTVLATHAYTKTTTVYNLTVDAVHTFYVVAGGTSVLVHNNVCLLDSVGNDGDVVVLGNLPDTEVAKSWPGHVVLDDPNWTPAGNADWIDLVASNRRPVYLASPLRHDTLWDARNARPKVFQHEINALIRSGYEFVDETMMVPK
ncbi:MAG TPA: polymorphic toxin-type HINT domain-containing protein, partial [Mycobacteriales bacterium]